jgi:formate C-acetyltransferase
MRQLPLCISADELIVGNQTRKPHGAIFHDESAVRRPSAFQFLNLNSDLDSPDYKLVIEKGVLAIKHQLEEKTRALGSAVSRSGMDEVNGCRAPSTPATPAGAGAKSGQQRRTAGRRGNQRLPPGGTAGQRRHSAPRSGPSGAQLQRGVPGLYLFQLALQLDNGSYAVNPEGADKALLPYYQHDINNGALPRSRRMKSSNRCGSSWRS